MLKILIFQCFEQPSISISAVITERQLLEDSPTVSERLATGCFVSCPLIRHLPVLWGRIIPSIAQINEFHFY